MFQNTKLLIIFTIAILVLGLLFLFYFKGNTIEPVTTEVSKSEATSSGILVTKVIDGDTIEIEGGKRIRVLGIDTPETKDPRKPVQCFGKEASNKSKELLEGKRVILEKDITDKDKYGRLLRYVYLLLPDGNLLFVDDYLVREGFGQVLTIPPDVKFADQLLDAQKQARTEKKGLWQKCL